MQAVKDGSPFLAKSRFLETQRNVYTFLRSAFVRAVLVLFMDEHRPPQLSCLVDLREQKGGSAEKGEREYGIEEEFITSEREFPFSRLYANVLSRFRSGALNGD